MPKRTPLVCQHLENISREALEESQDIVRHYVRNRQGVSALYRRGKLYYVGLAGNLRTRLGHHLKDRHADSWDRFSVYLTIGDSHLRELESLILRIVKPPGNKQKGKFARSEDVRRRFGHDIRARMRRSLSELLGRPAAVLSPAPRVERTDSRKSVLADYVTGRLALRARHKGRTLWPSVRKSGLTRFDGEYFRSPSVAAARAVKRVSCNGWTFWHYQRAPGDWVALDELRR